MKLTEINDFFEYVTELFLKQDEYIVFITSSDAHVPPNPKNPKLKILRSLGIHTDLQRAYRHSFLAVISGGETVVEDSHMNRAITAEYVFSEHQAKIMSQGFNAMPKTNSPVSINIDGVEYAVNKRGLNIVVWGIKEDRVIDSVVFDTFLDGSITRKDVNVNFEALCGAYKIICELAYIEMDFVCYYSKVLSRDKLNVDGIYEYLSKNAAFLAKTQCLIKQGITVPAFEHTNAAALSSPIEWEKICCSNYDNGFLKKDLDKYFEASGMSHIYNRETFEEILRHPIRSENIKGYFRSVPQSSQYVNVDSFGQRPTESFPETPYKTIYIFGNSIGCTWEMADRHTLTNQLQELVKDRFRVVNCSIAGTGFDNAGRNMLDIQFESGDVVIFIWGKGAYANIKVDLERIGISLIDLLPYFNAPHTEEIFFDRQHPNPNGYKIIADVMNAKIREHTQNSSNSQAEQKFTPPQCAQYICRTGRVRGVARENFRIPSANRQHCHELQSVYARAQASYRAVSRKSGQAVCFRCRGG